ncbi:MAG: hypothetical protein WCT04_05380 [Planctomycetota bacterium]
MAQSHTSKFAQERAEGRAEGTIDAILDLCADGVISKEIARSRLERFAREGAIPQAWLKDVLAGIDALGGTH